MSFSLQHSLLLLKVFIPLGSMSKTKRSLTNLHVLYTSPYAYDGSYPFGHFLTHFNKVSVWASFFLCPFGHFYLHFPFCTSPRFSVSAHAPTTVWAPAPSCGIANCTTIRDKSILSTGKIVCPTYI